MKHITTLLLALTLLTSGQGAADAALVKYDLAKLTDRSEHIVVGKVIKLESYWGKMNDVGPVILTDITIEVSETWKGTTPLVGGKKQLKIQNLGGTVGTRWMKCPESPEFAIGEKVLVFARTYNDALWATGWLQGKYSVTSSTSPSGSPSVTIEGKAGAPLAPNSVLGTVKGQVAARLISTSKTKQKADLRGDAK